MEIQRVTAVATYVMVPLIDASARPSYRASPTLAAGDVVIVRHTGGVWDASNITNLPATAGTTKQVLVQLTATEMTSDNLDYPIVIQFVDQTATKEWDDQEIVIWTKPNAVNAIQVGGDALGTHGTGFFPADCRQLLGTAFSPPDTAGMFDVNLKKIDNQATSGNNATLNLKQLNIVNSAGDAIVASATGSNGRGMAISGNGSGAAISAIGGATGNGIYAQAGGTSGHAMSLYASYGSAIYGIAAQNGNALYLQSQNTGSAIMAIGGNGYQGAEFQGGGTGGYGMRIYSMAGNSTGLRIDGNGSGAGVAINGGSSAGVGLICTGFGTANGASFYGGAISGSGMGVYGGGTGAGLWAVSGSGATGNGISCVANSTNGHGLSCWGNGTGNGLNCLGGATSGDGFNATGSGTGHGINTQSGSGASGDGFHAVALSTAGRGIYAKATAAQAGLYAEGGASGGSGMVLQGGANGGHGMYAAGGATVGYTQAGIYAIGGGVGAGLFAQGGAGYGTNGIHAVAAAAGGNGLACYKGSGGYDLKADEIQAIKTKTDSLTFTVANQVDVNVVDWKGATAPAMTGDAYAVVTNGTYGNSALQTQGAAIKAKTDQLTFTVANKVDATATVSGTPDVNVVNWKGSTAPAMTGDAYARLGAPAGASIAADIAAIPANVWGYGSGRTITDKANFTLTSAYDAAKTAASATAVATLQTSVNNLGSPMQAGTAVALAASQPNYAPAKAGDAMTLTSAYDPAKTAAQASALATTDGKVDGIKAKTDQLIFTGAYLNSQVKAMDTDSISAAAVSAAAVTKIQTGLGSGTDVAAIKAQTDKMNFTGANIKAVAEVIATDAVNAAALATDAVAEIQSGLANSADVLGINTKLDAIYVAEGETKNSVDIVGADVQDIVALLPSSGKISNFALTDTVDGIPVSQAFELALCMVNGRFRKDYPNTGDLTFYKRDNVTVLFTAHVTETERTRT